MEWMLMPLKRYAEFSGRSRRMEFWMWVVFQFLIGLAFIILMVALGGAAIMSGDVGGAMAMGGILLILYLLYFLVQLVFLVPGLAVTIRRLHDTNRSGWWIMLFWGPYLLSYVLTFVFMGSLAASADPTAFGADNAALGSFGLMVMILSLAGLGGGLILLVLLFLEGTKGPNRYGDDPKGQNAGQIFA
jgi:uncharacterized membrane protein YhaH (DUF805 family)